jgi:hypothetical protein
MMSTPPADRVGQAGSADSRVATLYVCWEEALLPELAERRVPMPLVEAILPARVWM